MISVSDGDDIRIRLTVNTVDFDHFCRNINLLCLFNILQLDQIILKKRPSLAKLLRLWGLCIRDDLDGFDPDGFGCFMQMTPGQSEFL